MSKYLVLNILIFLATIGFAQESIVELNQVRDSIATGYIRHTDTMTRNTWLNIMQSNKYLQQILHYDSMIMKAIPETKNEDSLRNALMLKLTDAEKKLKTLEQRNLQIKSDLDFYKKMYFMALILSALFLVIIVILIVLAGRLNRSVKEKDKKVKEYYTNFYSAQNELEASRKTENQLASEINKLNKQIKDNSNENREPLEKLNEEKLMLENQILEVKKAYEMEAAKRMELEANSIHESRDEDRQLIGQLTEKLESIQDEYELLKAENEKAQQELTDKIKTDDDLLALKEELEKQKQERTALEKKFTNLAEKIKSLSSDL